MPEDLLLELEPAPGVADSLENVEDLVRVISRNVGMAVEGMRGTASAWENAWRNVMVRDIANGQTAGIQSERTRFLNAFERRLTILKLTHRFANWLRELGRADEPDANVLLPEIAGMERLKTNVFDRWQTAEDLEDLAARDYPLTTAEIDQIGPQLRPPPSYYAEESKPF
jgi:hypothetical protein